MGVCMCETGGDSASFAQKWLLGSCDLRGSKKALSRLNISPEGACNASIREPSTWVENELFSLKTHPLSSPLLCMQGERWKYLAPLVARV